MSRRRREPYSSTPVRQQRSCTGRSAQDSQTPCLPALRPGRHACRARNALWLCGKGPASSRSRSPTVVLQPLPPPRLRAYAVDLAGPRETPRPRSDRGHLRKVEPELVQDAIEQVLPDFHEQPKNIALVYRRCIERGLLRREQVAPNTFRRVVNRF